jgi:hypothetical protein
MPSPCLVIEPSTNYGFMKKERDGLVYALNKIKDPERFRFRGLSNSA